VEIVSTEGSRKVSVEKLYTGDALRPLSLSHDEIIREAIIANKATVQGSAFAKFSMRGGVEFAGLTVAVYLEMANSANICAAARITVGAVASGPARAIQAEKAMAGQKLSDTLFQKIAETVAAETRPLMHHGYSAPFLRECLRVQTYRTLKRAAKRIQN
jgi:CO/xanthine dehydrogenase FAD-binding subunit